MPTVINAPIGAFGAAITVLFLLILLRREWTWIGVALALCFAASSLAYVSEIVRQYALARQENLLPTMRLCLWVLMYVSAMVGVLSKPRPYWSAVIIIACLYMIYYSAIPLAHLALSKDASVQIHLAGQPVGTATGAITTLCLGFAPAAIGVPWTMGRLTGSQGGLLYEAYARYTQQFGIGIVVLATMAAIFAAKSTAGFGPYSGMWADDTISPANLGGGVKLFAGISIIVTMMVLWATPKRFIEQLLVLVDNEDLRDEWRLEDNVAPMWRRFARSLDQRREQVRRSQQALESARAQLKAFFDHVPVAMSLQGLDGRFVFASSEVHKAYGMTADELVERSIESLAEHWPKFDELAATTRSVVVTGAAQRIMTPFKRSSDSDEQIYDVVAFPIPGPDGSIAQIGSLGIDVTAEYRVREELFAARSQLEAFVRNAPVPMIVADMATGRFVLANDEVASLYGLPVETLLTKTTDDMREYWLDWDRDFVPMFQQLAVQGVSRNIETRIRQVGTREIRTVLMSNFLIPGADDGSRLLGSVSIDITQFKQEQIDLAIERAGQFSALFEHVPADISVFDKNDRVVLVNKTTADGYGKRPEDFVGRHPGEYGQFWEDFDSILNAGIEVRKSGKPKRFTSKFNSPTKKRKIVYDTMFFPIKSRDGSIEQVGLFLFDVTKQVEAEHALSLQQEQAHQSEKLAALGQLLAGVAHELNNPLAIVKGRASILRERLAGTRHEEAITRLGEAADRCTRIVKTFLAMARQVGPQRGPVVINDLVEGALDMTSSGLKNAGIAIERNLASGIPEIESDGDQLVQAVMNLLVNAQHALEAHSGERRLRITTSHDQAKGEVAIEVADSGPGIPAEVAERIFEPFFTTKAVGQGTGLGLSVCKGMVETNGGSLTLTETPGGGATFRIALPVVAPSVALPKEAPKSHARRARKLKALVIDDEPDLIDVLTDGLGTLGFECQKASNGRMGLDAIAKTRFDAVFCDVRMPEMDGLAFYRALREKHPELLERLAFISGDVLHNDVVQLTAEAACPVIEKPFDLDQVRATALALVAAGAKT